eukprot:g12543.t1
MNNPVFTTLAVIAAGIAGIGIAILLWKYLGLWLRAYVTRARIGLPSLAFMSLRRINPKTVVDTKVMAVQAGLTNIATRDLESHLLAGGRTDKVVRALIAAQRARIELDWNTAAAIDLAGRDVLNAVAMSVAPRVIDCPNVDAPGRNTLDGIAKDGIQLKVRARVTVRANLNQLVGGATEETVVARVGEGIVSAIGSCATHQTVLANPMVISKRVLERGLDAQTAFAIVSIDIGSIEVGDNVGARLQTDQAEADVRVALAKAEERRARAIATEQEMVALTQENRARRAGVSLLVGYLLIGAIIGEGGIGLVSQDNHELEYLARTGALLLLFSIGIEFSLGHLIRLGRHFLVGGTAQMLLVACPLAGACMLMGMDWKPALLVAAAGALSSTILVFKALSETDRSATPYGRRAIGILLFQDVALVPLILLVPLLTGAGEGPSAAEFGSLAGKSLLFVLAVVLLRRAFTRWVIPLLAHLRSVELVVLFSLLVLGAAGWASFEIGLPPALGALAAGLMLSGNRLSKQIDTLVLPFRETFAAVFFVTLGTLLHPLVFFDDPLLLSAGLIGILVLKTAAAAVALKLTGLNWKASFGMGVGLAQLGEFSFLLLTEATAQGVISPDDYKRTLFIALGTLILTPLLIKVGLPWAESAGDEQPDSDVHAPLSAIRGQRALVVGIGPVGGQIASLLSEHDVDVQLADLSQVNLHPFAQLGFSTVVGDARKTSVLEKVHAGECRLAVVCVREDKTANEITRAIREMNPGIHIVVRCRFGANIETALSAGADAVVRNPDDPMIHHEIASFARVLETEDDRIGVFDLLNDSVTQRQLDEADVMLLGGSGHYSAAGEGEWLDRALDSLRLIHDHSEPTFASCWGFQAMARAMGGKVVKHIERAEVGTHTLTLTDAGKDDPIFGPLGETFLGQMGHEDCVDELPENTTLLASSRRVVNQAYRFDDAPIYCTQFHPELNYDDLLVRVTNYPEYIERIAGVPPERFPEMLDDTTPSEGLLKRFIIKYFG